MVESQSTGTTADIKPKVGPATEQMIEPAITNKQQEIQCDLENGKEIDPEITKPILYNEKGTKDAKELGLQTVTIPVKEKELRTYDALVKI